VRRVIGGNDVNSVFYHGSEKSFLVGASFNGGIAFDVCASRRVPTVIAKEVVDASFRGDFLRFDWPGSE
jgi:hypothetical protein